MSDETLEFHSAPPARVEIHHDGLVFNPRNPNGTVAESAAVGLADLARKANDGDVLPILAFGVFMQLNRLNIAIETAQKSAEAAIYDPTDPDIMAKKLGPMMGVVANLFREHGLARMIGLGDEDRFDEVVADAMKTSSNGPDPQPAGAVRNVHRG